MKSVEQLSQEVKVLNAKVRTQNHELDRLRQEAENQAVQTAEMLIESKRAQEIATKSFRVDHDGWIWRWDVNRKLYVKTTNRVNTPVIPCGAIKSRHIAKGAVTLDKLDIESIGAISGEVASGYANNEDIESLFNGQTPSQGGDNPSQGGDNPSQGGESEFVTDEEIISLFGDNTGNQSQGSSNTGTPEDNIANDDDIEAIFFN